MYWKTKLAARTLLHLKSFKDFIVFLTHRAQGDTVFRVAASLSYTSLIAIVPLLAMGLAIFSAFPVFSEIREQLQEFALQNFIPKAENEIRQYIGEFINATAKLTTIGVVSIVITSILMLSTIENSLNFIFKVYKPRNLKTKITLYWTVITLGPLLLGAAFSLRSYMFALQKFMPETLLGSQFLLPRLLPPLITLLTLLMIYVLVPNKKVNIKDALVGSVVALFLFWILRQGFSFAISLSGTYKTLYGALATVPVFLIWMFSAWSVVIFGAVVTASLAEYRNRDKEQPFPLAARSREQRLQRIHRKNEKGIKKFLPKEQN